MTSTLPPQIPDPRAPIGTKAPRLIATDLDGTLLTSEKTISTRTIAALAAAESAGVEVFFVTGRPHRWMDVVSAYSASHGIAICANGAAVLDLHRGRLLDVNPITAADALAAVRLLRSALPRTVFAVEYTGGISREPGYPLPETWAVPQSPVAPVETLLSQSPGPVLKLLAKHPGMDPDRFLALGRELAGEHVEVTRSSSLPLLEISALGVSKATTLARCCAERGIDPSEVVAFGDMPNDLPMLSWAGTSYAVANAHPDVLAATTHHTKANDEDGVAVIIEELVAELL